MLDEVLRGSKVEPRIEFVYYALEACATLSLCLLVWGKVRFV